MKNFKLLLATTAILSTGAIVANAVLPGLSDSTDLKVTAEVVKTLNINVDRNLDFGRISLNPDYTDEEGAYVELRPDSNGGFTPFYNNIAFHDGGETAKICFTDLVPEATEQDGLYVLGSNFEIKDSNEDIIGDVDFGTSRADAGVVDGTRCFYMGAQLSFNKDAKDFSGKIEETTTITVIYDSVNN